MVLGYIIIRSPYTPYSIYLRGTIIIVIIVTIVMGIGFRAQGYPPTMENRMEKKMDNDMETVGIYRGYLWFAGNERMKKMDTTSMSM